MVDAVAFEAAVAEDLPGLQRKAPRPALARRVRTLTTQNRRQLPEGSRAQPGERGDAHLAGEDELLVRRLNGGSGTREGIEAYFRHRREQWDTAGPLRAFGIRMGTAELLAGTIDLRFAGEGLAPGQVNVAYGLYPSWRGRGLATRAVLLATRYAASEGGAEAVIQVEPENPASAAA